MNGQPPHLSACLPPSPACHPTGALMVADGSPTSLASTYKAPEPTPFPLRTKPTPMCFPPPFAMSTCRGCGCRHPSAPVHFTPKRGRAGKLHSYKAIDLWSIKGAGLGGAAARPPLLGPLPQSRRRVMVQASVGRRRRGCRATSGQGYKETLCRGKAHLDRHPYGHTHTVCVHFGIEAVR